MSTPGRSKRKRKPASTRPSTRAYTADIAAALVSDPVEDDLPRYQALIDAAAAHDDSWFQRCFPAFSRFVAFGEAWQRRGLTFDLLVAALCPAVAAAS